MTHRVFVYGTLKRHFRNHAFLENAVFKGEDVTAESVFDMIEVYSDQEPGGTYPAVVEGGCYSISGEVYEVNDEGLKVLDDLEDLGSLYKREETALLHLGKAFMYIDIGNVAFKCETTPHISRDTERKILSWVPNPT